MCKKFSILPINNSNPGDELGLEFYFVGSKNEFVGLLMEGVVADVFLQAFGGAGTVGQVAQDDGDDAGGVVDDFGVVFEIAVLTGMEAVVVTGLEEFGPHTHKLLAGCAEVVVDLEKPLFHER